MTAKPKIKKPVIKKPVAKKATKKTAKKKPAAKKDKESPFKNATSFTDGNQFWLLRSKHGVNPKFENPEDLQEACLEYFQWVENNPLKEEKVFHTNGQITYATVSKVRALTIGGLCLYLGIHRDTWCEWRKNRADLSEVIGWADEAIYQQKFSAASADLLNANIISRELGLADKSEITGKGGAPIETIARIKLVGVRPKGNGGD